VVRLLGFLDDYAKVKSGSGDRGLSERHKLLLQGLFSAAFAGIFVSPMVRWGGTGNQTLRPSINTLWQIWDFLRHSDFLFCAVCIECRQYH